jgi:hypothetical protein
LHDFVAVGEDGGGGGGSLELGGAELESGGGGGALDVSLLVSPPPGAVEPGAPPGALVEPFDWLGSVPPAPACEPVGVLAALGVDEPVALGSLATAVGGPGLAGGIAPWCLIAGSAPLVMPIGSPVIGTPRR